MAGEPNIGVWIELCDVAVEFCGGLVVSIFSPQGLDETGLVASESGGGAVTDLFPEIMPPLTTTAAEEEVVVYFILCGGTRTIEDCRGSAFESDHYRFIVLVGKNVTAEAVAFPTEAVGVVEACVDVLPFASAWLGVIGVGCHDGEVDDSLFVRDVRGWYLIECPGG